MPIQACTTEDWFDEPTFTEGEHEARAMDCMLASLAEVVRAALPVSTILVVARGHGLPSGIHVDELGSTKRQLDPVVLAQLLADGHDDRAVTETCRLVIGNVDRASHLVAHGSDGTIVGLVAVALRDHAPIGWVRLVLARIAASLAAWATVNVPSPSSALLSAIDEPVIIHDAGTVLAANTAVADILDCEPIDLVGRRAARVLLRVPMLQAGSLVLGAQPRAALILDDTGFIAEASLAAIVRRVIAAHYTTLRSCARVSVEVIDHGCVAVPAEELEAIATLAVLDCAACFAGADPHNLLVVRVFRETGNLALEVTATGGLASGGHGASHLGAAVCATRVRALGGRIVVDVSEADRRVIKVALPAVAS